MAHESNADRNIGSQNPGLTADDFKKKFGMTDTQSANAADAAKK